LVKEKGVLGELWEPLLVNMTGLELLYLVDTWDLLKEHLLDFLLANLLVEESVCLVHKSVRERDIPLA